MATKRLNSLPFENGTSIGSLNGISHLVILHMPVAPILLDPNHKPKDYVGRLFSVYRTLNIIRKVFKTNTAAAEMEQLIPLQLVRLVFT